MGKETQIKYLGKDHTASKWLDGAPNPRSSWALFNPSSHRRGPQSSHHFTRDLKDGQKFFKWKWRRVAVAGGRAAGVWQRTCSHGSNYSMGWTGSSRSHFISFKSCVSEIKCLISAAVFWKLLHLGFLLSPHTVCLEHSCQVAKATKASCPIALFMVRSSLRTPLRTSSYQRASRPRLTAGPCARLLNVSEDLNLERSEREHQGTAGMLTACLRVCQGENRHLQNSDQIITHWANQH